MADFYGDSRYLLETALREMMGKVELIRTYQNLRGKRELVEHCKGRIKSEESMREKLERKGLAVTVDNALHVVQDAVGIRIVCRFVDDVYEVAKMLSSLADLSVLETKDYIANPKPNGYRSYHMILVITITLPDQVVRVPVEVQIRTIAQDSWAALEHQLKYKKDVPNVKLIQQELKRCADEMASTDLSLQTVREMIEMTESE